MHLLHTNYAWTSNVIDGETHSLCSIIQLNNFIQDRNHKGKFDRLQGDVVLSKNIFQPVCLTTPLILNQIKPQLNQRAIIRNRDGNQGNFEINPTLSHDASTKESTQGNLEIKPNHIEEKTNPREHNSTMIISNENKLDKITKVNSQGNIKIQPNHKEYNANQRENNLSTMVTTNYKTTSASTSAKISLANWVIKKGKKKYIPPSINRKV